MEKKALEITCYCRCRRLGERPCCLLRRGLCGGFHLGAYSKEVADEINTYHTNESYLPGITFPVNVRATNSFDFLKTHDLVLLMVPAQHMRSVVRELRPYLKEGAVLVHGAKGIEKGTLKRISEVVIEETENKHPVMVLSGPTHAEEVAKKCPPPACLQAQTKSLPKKSGNADASHIQDLHIQ